MLPLLTSIVILVVIVFPVRQSLQQGKFHQVPWTIGVLFYGISALMKFLMNPDVIGANLFIFGVYSILAASLVGLLGGGRRFSIDVKKQLAIM